MLVTLRGQRININFLGLYYKGGVLRSGWLNNGPCTPCNNPKLIWDLF